MVKRFYRHCFYRELVKTLGSHGSNRGGALSKFLALRRSKIKSMYAFFKKDPGLTKKYPFLCGSVAGCRMPKYLQAFKMKPSKKSSVPCSKTRYCAFCWVRINCKAYSRMTRNIDKAAYPGYGFFYNERVILLPMTTSHSILADQGLSLFSHRNKYSGPRLASSRIAGIAETLVVHSATHDNVRMYKLTLRQIAYCHKDSVFAKSSKSGSAKRFGTSAVDFCCFPVSMLYDGPLRSMSLDEIFRRRRLVRQYGIFYNSGAPSGDVSSE